MAKIKFFLNLAMAILLVNSIDGASISMVRSPAVPVDDQLTSNALPVSAQDYTPSMIRCYCNMPTCLEASGGVPTCTTRQGCFSELQPTVPITETTTPPQTTRSPIPVPEEFIEGRIMINSHQSHLNGAYGCLELFAMNQTCHMILRSVDYPASEFPTIQKSSMIQNSTTDDIVRAYHCCQSDMCNEKNHVAATIQAARDALMAAIRNSMNQEEQIQIHVSDNSTNDMNITATTNISTASNNSSTVSDLTQATTEVTYMQNNTSPNDVMTIVTEPFSTITTTTTLTTSTVTDESKNNTANIDNSTFSNNNKFIVTSTVDNMTTTQKSSSAKAENTTTIRPSHLINIYVSEETVGVTEYESYPTKMQEINYTTPMPTTTVTTEFVTSINMTNKEESQSLFHIINKREEQKEEPGTTAIYTTSQEFLSSTTTENTINDAILNITSQNFSSSLKVEYPIEVTTVNNTLREFTPFINIEDPIEDTNIKSGEFASSIKPEDPVEVTTVNIKSRESVLTIKIEDPIEVTTMNITTIQPKEFSQKVEIKETTKVDAITTESTKGTRYYKHLTEDEIDENQFEFRQFN